MEILETVKEENEIKEQRITIIPSNLFIQIHCNIFNFIKVNNLIGNFYCLYLNNVIKLGINHLQ